MLRDRTTATHAYHVTELPPEDFTDEDTGQDYRMYHLLWWIDHTGTMYEIRNKHTTITILRCFVPAQQWQDTQPRIFGEL